MCDLTAMQLVAAIALQVSRPQAHEWIFAVETGGELALLCICLMLRRAANRAMRRRLVHHGVPHSPLSDAR